MNPSCRICGTHTNAYGCAEVLEKYQVSYYVCPECGFIQTEEPYWLDEAYSDAIASTDIGLCSRNVQLACSCDIVFRALFGKKKRFLDYGGGGYGMFVRLMRDRGYDFEWYDEYCQNIFAKGHEMAGGHYDVLTSFEMLEHLTNPMEIIKKLFSLADTVVFTTELVPASRPDVNAWWYFAPEHGQHVAFYTKKSLAHVARIFGKQYYGLQELHILTDEKIAAPLRRLLMHGKTGRLLSCFFPRRDSLLSEDYQTLTGKKLH